MPGYVIVLKTLILKAIIFLLQLKGGRRITNTSGSLAFGKVIHSLSGASLSVSKQTGAQVPIIRLK